ncbi:hypothetical protein [Methylobacterium sp. ARG-1]|uniref:hypothetical protein n=1 Tax=Methylobacterium sp. ARG-1 TaxID=1692501 RepID=UPI000681C767|nr:hypothetical protein [Methylobacterium sp. ARG-1]
MLDQPRATELVNEIGSMIVGSEGFRARDWHSLSVVVVMEGEAVHLFGYTYDAAGEPEAGVPGDFDLNDRFEELRAAMTEPGGRPWVSALMQIKRSDRGIDIDFEYDDPGRWRVTPANVETKPGELRPR